MLFGKDREVDLEGLVSKSKLQADLESILSRVKDLIGVYEFSPKIEKAFEQAEQKLTSIEEILAFELEEDLESLQESSEEEDLEDEVEDDQSYIDDED